MIVTKKGHKFKKPLLKDNFGYVSGPHNPNIQRNRQNVSKSTNLQSPHL